MKKFILISLFSIAQLEVSSQHCQIKDSLTYEDSLNLFLDFTFHLYANKKIEFQAKFISTFAYEGYNRVDSVFYFLIPDSEQETQGDGDFISYHVHRASILKQSNPKWFEITELYRVEDHYAVNLTLNTWIDNEVSSVYLLSYKTHCENPKRPLIFKKERIKKLKD